MPDYFALPKETLQEVLKYLTQKDASAALYEKVSQALPVKQEAPAQVEAQPVDVTPTTDTTPSAN